MFANWSSLLPLVLAFSGVLTYLSDPPTPGLCVKRFVVIVGVLLALVAFGAVSGKTLGDFLRGVNG
jgi:hypothetical protein